MHKPREITSGQMDMIVNTVQHLHKTLTAEDVSCVMWAMVINGFSLVPTGWLETIFRGCAVFLGTNENGNH